MKQIKLAVIALFMFAGISNVNAQDSDNPWVVGFGVNAIDMYGGSDFGTQFKDMLGSSDWNILPSISRISVDKYLEKGFTVQLAGSINKIENHLGKDDANYIIWSLGAMVKYDLNNLFGDTSWFDPYVGLGGDYVNSGRRDESELMAHGALGFNIWFNDNLGLNFQHGSKLGFAKDVRSHYQNSLGLVFKFGGKDTDGDGVYDKNDACPEVAGLKEFNGCPDADGDGVKDSEDACPNVAGLAEMNGCPDTDGDGVADKNDMCPNLKGTKANKGCPDADGDGVVDKDDNCVTIAGPAANKGCPWPDTDGDGVLDKDDKCVTVPGVPSENGCPERVIQPSAMKAINMAAQTINFKSGSTRFNKGVTSELDKIVSLMKEFSRATFAISGYTDSFGRVSSNLKLSQRRANAVMSYFVKKGIKTSRLTSKGYGVANPIASNKTRAGRAKNRRVEIKVTN